MSAIPSNYIKLIDTFFDKKFYHLIDFESASATPQKCSTTELNISY